MTQKKKIEGGKRLDEARGDFRRMKKEIAPFVKERDRSQHSTAGQWRTTRGAASQHSNQQSRGGY